ncbi:MFS transporter [Ahrensia sp. R2A130]|uniref:MFS transporter n=1 Tax=Ahrensia sp. R2A130 TaxID=744979 RepID=UPI0001E08CAA|nr:MFS transporter [Ahrensia sp. R2A130]EFL88132.1 major facilitator transporter [Ahrensia sp. R2A130]
MSDNNIGREKVRAAQAPVRHAVDEPTEAKVGKKGIWGWMLFDWAAQPFHTLIITFIFAPYFAASVAPDGVTGQAYWGYAAAIGGILIAALSPVLGSIADASGPRKPWIFGFSLLAIAGSIGLWWAEPNAGSSGVLFALVAFIITMIGFEFAAVFNNAMMPSLVPRAQLGRLSGNAWALGYIAGLLTLIVVLLTMATNSEGKTLLGIEPLFGIDASAKEGERASGPLTGLWYLVFVIPLFLFTPDAEKKEKSKGAVKAGLQGLWNTIKSLPQTPSLFAYLGSSMIYRDALNGLYTFGGIYAVGVLKWDIVQVGIFGILANLTGVAGAFLGGRADAAKGPKFVVVTSVIVLMISSLIIVTTSPTSALFMQLESGSNLPTIVFYICGGFIGAAGGALQAASRTLMVDQAHPDRMAEAFGLYALSGRATSFIAPLMIGIITTATGSQQLGVAPVVVLFFLALLLLPLVKQKKPGELSADG